MASDGFGESKNKRQLGFAEEETPNHRKRSFLSSENSQGSEKYQKFALPEIRQAAIHGLDPESELSDFQMMILTKQNSTGPYIG